MTTTASPRIVVTKAPIDDITLTITRGPDPAVNQFDIELSYRINWSSFDQLTNLSYREVWQLVGMDGAAYNVLYSAGGLFVFVSSNGNASTRRTKQVTVQASTLDEDPNGLDEIAAEIVLQPVYPGEMRVLSAPTIVAAP